MFLRLAFDSVATSTCATRDDTIKCKKVRQLSLLWEEQIWLLMIVGVEAPGCPEGLWGVPAIGGRGMKCFGGV